MLISSAKNTAVRRLLSEQSDAVRSCLDRLNVSCVTWAQLADHLAAYQNALGNGAGDRTLKRLIRGPEQEIRAHPRAGIQKHDRMPGRV